MNWWLEHFAYKTEIGISSFLIGGIAALLIAVLTVTYQSVKAATANPTNALRYE
jgi:putative ABC transport system permease protein